MQNFTKKELSEMMSAVNEQAILLRTNYQTSVVSSEKDFLAKDISEGRRNHYLFLKELAAKIEAEIK